MIMIIVLLAVPIYFLYHITSANVTATGYNAICVGILVVSTLAFSACISLFTSKSHKQKVHQKF